MALVQTMALFISFRLLPHRLLKSMGNVMSGEDAVIATFNPFLHVPFEPLLRCDANEVLPFATTYNCCLESISPLSCKVLHMEGK